MYYIRILSNVRIGRIGWSGVGDMSRLIGGDLDCLDGNKEEFKEYVKVLNVLRKYVYV